MRSEQENFEQVRRLLALKRHEQPPPGYFNGFSRQVIARIQAGEAAAAESLFERICARVPWLRGLWEGFEAKPLVAGAFGVGVCSLLVVGLVSSERIDSNPPPFSAATADSAQPVFTQSVGLSLFERASTEHVATGSVYTAQSRSSIFEEIQNPHVQRVTFSVPAAGN